MGRHLEVDQLSHDSLSVLEGSAWSFLFNPVSRCGSLWCLGTLILSCLVEMSMVAALCVGLLLDVLLLGEGRLILPRWPQRHPLTCCPAPPTLAQDERRLLLVTCITYMLLCNTDSREHPESREAQTLFSTQTNGQGSGVGYSPAPTNAFQQPCEPCRDLMLISIRMWWEC